MEVLEQIETKTCTGCNKTLPATLEHFKAQKRGKYGLEAKCRSCRNKWRSDYRRRNPMLFRRMSRDWHLKSCYGMTTDEYNKLYALQNGRCAMCDRQSKKLVVDHCHKTGKVRSLLCFKCNTIVGAVENGLDLAINYLKRFGVMSNGNT